GFAPTEIDGGVVQEDLDSDVRVRGTEWSELFGEPERADAFARGDAYGAGELGVAPGEAALDGDRFRVHARGALEDGLARFGEAEPAGTALEQAHVELRFELVDLTADRGLADTEPTRRGGERAGLRNHEEMAKKVPGDHLFIFV